MVVGMHDPQQSEVVSTLRMIGRPTRSSGSPRPQDADQALPAPRVAMASPADTVGAEHEVV